MKMRKTLLMLMFLVAINNLLFGQLSSSATYELGDIDADPFFLAAHQSSSCPGTLSVNVPIGVTIVGVDVTYGFEALNPNMIVDQRSQLRCVSPGGSNESTVATFPNHSSGVNTYTRTGLDIANGVTAGGDIEFELHAGFDNLAAAACGTDFHRIVDSTWTVTVYYLDSNAPVAVTNPGPANEEEGVLVSTDLSWDFGVNTDNYDLYMGTDNPPTTLVVDNVSTGGVGTGSYDPGTLEGSSFYYWQVVSRNSAKLEVEGPVWSFSTVCGQTPVPVSTDFDALNAPSWGSSDVMPLCWNKIVNCSQSWAKNGVYNTWDSYSSPNVYCFENGGDSQANSFLVSPQIGANGESLSQMTIGFFAKRGYSATGPLYIGTMSDPLDTATFTVYQSIELTDSYQEFEVTFGGYSGTDDYIAIKYDAAGSTGNESVYLDDVLIDFSPTCPKPNDLYANAITVNSANIGWHEQGEASEWNIEYVLTGEMPSGTSNATANTNPFVLTDLEAGTAYDFYVQANCGAGDESYWVGPHTFKTYCNPASTPLAENFDSISELPDCWTVTASAGGVCDITEYSYYSEPHCYYMQMSNADDYMMWVSPMMDVGSVSELQINFVGMLTWGVGNIIAGTMEDANDPATFNPVDTISLSDVWTEYEVWFNQSPETDQFIALACDQATASTYIYVDDLVVDYLPPCLNPVDVHVTDVATNEATLNWTESGTAIEWEIEVGWIGFTPGTGTSFQDYHYAPGVAPAEYSYLMSGLDAGTFYEAYIRAINGDQIGDTSLWSNPAMFMTAVEAFPYLPQTEDYEPNFEITANVPTSTVAWTINDSIRHGGQNSVHNAYDGACENTLLVLGSMDFSWSANTSLSFWQIAKTENNSDHCYVEISTDGGLTYDQLPESSYLGLGNYTLPQYENPEGPAFSELSYSEWGMDYENPDNSWWRKEVFDLSSYVGNDNVMIRFRLVSNKWNAKAGWFIDDIELNNYHGVDINVDPAALEVSVEQGASTTETLTIENLDDMTLKYTATIAEYSEQISSIYSENFDLEIPSDWTVLDEGSSVGVGDNWISQDAIIYGNSLDGTNFAFVQRQYPDTAMESLISPVIDASGYATVYLSFDQNFAYASDDYAEVLVWDGTEWQQVYFAQSESVGSWNDPDSQQINITQYANPDMQVKFYYHATSWSRWAIDNVDILGSDIPLDWLTLNGETSVGGLVDQGAPQTIDVEFFASPSAPIGSWHTNIEIASNDPQDPIILVPCTMNIIDASFMTTVTASPEACCIGESVQLQASTVGGSGNYTYSWTSSPEGFTSTAVNPTDAPTETTTYFVEVSDGVSTIQGAITVTVNPLPEVILSDFEDVCIDGDAFALTGGSPVGGEYSGTGVSNGMFDPEAAGVGTYSITYTYTNSNGCENSTQADITVVDLPVVTLSDIDAVCVNESEFTLSGGSPAGGEYSGTGVSNGMFDPAAAGVGSHTITYTYSNETGCENTAQVDITVNPLPDVTLSDFDAVCVNESEFNLSGGSPVGGEYSGTGVSNGMFNPQTAGAGTFSITYTYADSNGCENSAEAEITVNDLPVVSLQDFDAVCIYHSAFELTGGSPVGGEYSGPGIANGLFDPAQAGLGTHTISYTFVDPNGCENFAEATILVDPCTGINEVSEGLQIEVYPNPNNGLFTLKVVSELSDKIDVRIMNNLGREVYNQMNVSLSGNHFTEVDLSQYSKGLYFIYITTAKNTFVNKVIVK